MPLQSINIPYQSGSVGSITYSSLYNNEGNHYVWVGGNNGRKFISVRLQSSPNFAFVDTLEISSMTDADPTFTSLYTRAESESFAAYKNNHINLCKVNSTTALLKIFTNSPTANGSSFYILEIDESDDSISITNVTSSNSAYQRGGMYDRTGQSASTNGRGRQHKYMMHLKDNNIVTLECIGSETSQNSYGGYHFVHRIWDPVNRTLTNNTVCTGNKDDSTNRDYSDFNTDWKVPSDSSGTGSTSTQNQDVPVLHGHNQNITNSYFSQGCHFHLSQTFSRDGNQVHFLMQLRPGNATSSTDDGHQNRTSIDNYSSQYYVITYIKDTDTWTITSKRFTSFNPPGYYGVWLPINTELASDFNPGQAGNFKSHQQHATTWLACDARYVRVCGVNNGGQISIVDTAVASSHRADGNSEAYEAYWLDEVHFVIVWVKREDADYVGNVNDSMHYTICKYTDENVIDVVSSGRLNDSSIQPSHMSYSGCGPILNKVDDFTYISNQFSHYVCLHAPA